MEPPFLPFIIRLTNSLKESLSFPLSLFLSPSSSLPFCDGYFWLSSWHHLKPPSKQNSTCLWGCFRYGLVKVGRPPWVCEAKFPQAVGLDRLRRKKWTEHSLDHCLPPDCRCNVIPAALPSPHWRTIPWNCEPKQTLPTFAFATTRRKVANMVSLYRLFFLSVFPSCISTKKFLKFERLLSGTDLKSKGKGIPCNRENFM